MNPNHPYGRYADANWAENLEAFLAKAANYGIKIVFHSMGNEYGTELGIVAPMFTYRKRTVWTPLAEALALIDKLAGDNALGKNFIADPRIAWWCPINEARLDDADVREWLIPILERIRAHGGKTSVCVNDGVHGYVDTFPYIIPIIGHCVDYLQAHEYHHPDVVAPLCGNLEADLYTPIYNAYFQDFQTMAAERGNFPLENVMLTEYGVGNGTWYGILGPLEQCNLTPSQQAQYIKAVFDAAKDIGISNLFYHEIFDYRTFHLFGFLEFNGAISSQESYDAFKNAVLPTPTLPIQNWILPVALIGIPTAIGLLYLETRGRG